MIMALPKGSPPGNVTPDIWYLAFVRLLQERAPPNFEILAYLPSEPQAGLVLLRHPDDIRQEATIQDQHQPSCGDQPSDDWVVPRRPRETAVSQNIEDIPGYDEILQKLLESVPAERVMALYTPEQRLAGLTAEQRLAGLTPDQVPSALSLTILRGLSEAYLRSLPPAIEQAIRQSIARLDD